MYTSLQQQKLFHSLIRKMQTIGILSAGNTEPSSTSLARIQGLRPLEHRSVAGGMATLENLH